MEICGTIGSKSMNVIFDGNSFSLNDKSTHLMNFICFQRTSSSLKTCDVIWINSSNVYVHTIDKKLVSSIKKLASVPIYDIGPDPAPWKKWHKRAKSEQWSLEDWNFFLGEEPDSDSDYVPNSEEDSEEDSEHTHKKRRKN